MSKNDCLLHKIVSVLKRCNFQAAQIEGTVTNGQTNQKKKNKKKSKLIKAEEESQTPIETVTNGTEKSIDESQNEIKENGVDEQVSRTVALSCTF